MSDLVTYIEQQKELFLPAVVDGKILWESEKQFAIQAFQGNKFLYDTASKNPSSLQSAIINVASTPYKRYQDKLFHHEALDKRVY